MVTMYFTVTNTWN